MTANQFISFSLASLFQKFEIQLAMAFLCSRCPSVPGRIFQRCFENNESSIEFLRSHGVVPLSVVCPLCGNNCVYRKDRHQWRCHSSFVIPRTKKRRWCNYCVSDFHGTFLEGTHLQAWQIVCFVYYWVQKQFVHDIALRNLQISYHTSVDWRSFCSEVCDYWFKNQEPIGGKDSC